MYGLLGSIEVYWQRSILHVRHGVPSPDSRDAHQRFGPFPLTCAGKTERAGPPRSLRITALQACTAVNVEEDAGKREQGSGYVGRPHPTGDGRLMMPPEACVMSTRRINARNCILSIRRQHRCLRQGHSCNNQVSYTTIQVY